MQGLTRKELLDELNRFLLMRAEEDVFCVLVIDEAQSISVHALEQLRMLSNLETAKKKLLQIILVGQLEFEETLKSVRLRSLNQRISIRYRIVPLSRKETKDYIYHRLRVAKAPDELGFSRGALRKIYRYSGGYPRLINLTCDRALLAGYSLRSHWITAGLVRRAIAGLRGSMSLDTEIAEAADLIQRSHYMVVLTGAGHSTASGIPDFRSPKSGLWEKADPMQVASIWSFRLKPETFFDWIRPLIRTMLDAQPNAAHFALAELERRGILKAVITQNIDNLHQRAGSQRVLELHGHMRAVTCVRCYKKYPVEPLIETLLTEGGVPHCPCGGVLKPDVILFGEQLPVRVFNEARAEAKRSDLFLVAGSSLEVIPAADLPYVALQSGAQGMIVNLQATDFDRHAQVVVHGDVTEILPAIVAALG
jgi:NAD-dependent deacetylase